MKEQEIIYINTDDYELGDKGESLVEARKNITNMQYIEGAVEVTISVIAYNRLDKTRRCVESILKHTKNINYELVLIDNGSETDDILDYYKGIQYKNKKILRITKNLETVFPYTFTCLGEIAPFWVTIPNDIIVTPNWLSNLLVCMKSDDRIGMVNPVSSNVSNVQEVGLSFSNYLEMEREAQKFNISDPRKWEERIRLITLATVYRKEALYAVGMPMFDIGFAHSFADDDISYQIRRAGYKLILAGDTWVHHDHDVFNMENKDNDAYERELEIGRNNFMEKYCGIDSWEEIKGLLWKNHISNLIVSDIGHKRILGIDVGTGESLLVLKNYLISKGVKEIFTEGFVQDAKYYVDCSSICNELVKCDIIENIRLYFPKLEYDYILLNKVINSYNEPLLVLQDAMELLKKDGILIFKLQNTNSYIEFLNLIGRRELSNENMVYHISYKQMEKFILDLGEIVYFGYDYENLDQESIDYIIKSYESTIGNVIPKNQKEQNISHLLTKEYIFFVKK